MRASYGKAFKAPTLNEVHAPITSYQAVVTDPLRGGQTELVNVVNGGNPNLRPETGQSRSFGLVYTSLAIPNLRVSVTHWAIDETNSIQALYQQAIIDNQNLFPGVVVRGP